MNSNYLSNSPSLQDGTETESDSAKRLRFSLYRLMNNCSVFWAFGYFLIKSSKICKMKTKKINRNHKLETCQLTNLPLLLSIILGYSEKTSVGDVNLVFIWCCRYLNVASMSSDIFFKLLDVGGMLFKKRIWRGKENELIKIHWVDSF